MAIGTVFGDVGVFVDERPLVFHVTAGADCFDLHALKIGGVRRVVWVVAIGAGHLVFWHRMMGGLAEFHLNRNVTGNACIILLQTAKFLLWPCVKFVAVETTHLVESMDAAVPVDEIRG